MLLFGGMGLLQHGRNRSVLQRFNVISTYGLSGALQKDEHPFTLSKHVAKIAENMK